MDKFLGLQIRRKPLTDAEHVERVRKDLQRSRRWGKWLITSQVALLLVYVYILQMITSVLWKLGGNQLQFGAGFAVGVLIGFLLGVPVLHLALQLVESIKLLKGDRTSALLVKYYDTLVKYRDVLVTLDQSGDDLAQQPPPPQGRGGQGRKDDGVTR